MTNAYPRISDWLVKEGLSEGSYEDLLSGFVERLNEGGYGIERAMLAVRTLHPTIDAHSLIWRRDGPIEYEDFSTDRGPTEAFRQSPLAALLQSPDLYEIRRRLTGPDARLDFPVLAELRDEGITDYLIVKVAFPVASLGGHQSGMLVSWSTDRPDGFSDAEIAGLGRLAPRLGLAMSNRLLREVTSNVLDTYVGRDAGKRILSGQIHRGSIGEIDAVILFFDLRGFTALADRLDAAVMAGLLNDYFECIVPSVVDRGGDILKFMGDGVLATFNLASGKEADICKTGLDAATEALRRVEEWNRMRRSADKPVLDLDVAIHLGRVMYGNVGAASRLDFTVIGAAVNEASRIEALCDELGRHLLVSERFAAAAHHCAGRLIAVGRHRLRGVRDEQQIFTVDYRT